MAEFASRATGNAGLTTGIVGTALGAINSGILGGGGLFGGGCGENKAVSRYEMGLQQTIAEQGSKIRLLEADKYTDGKMLEMYAYIDGKMRGISDKLAAQDVINAQVAANLGGMQATLAALSGLTKTVIPIDNVCPEPMPRHNTWTAPTANT